ncbi:MAG: radical SAM protein [Desulfobacterales bacterium]
MTQRARYLQAFADGRLREKVQTALARMECCTLCPRQCGVNRISGETGFCRTGRNAWVSSFSPHFGEESPLVGDNGSGTIFFTHCNLDCVFCQNYDISHLGAGEPVEDDALARMMLTLQRMGCHNVNFVTPSHVVPQILSAVEIAVPEGLSIPLVYNSGGYDDVETLKLLDGVIDIYMPDFKFWHSEASSRFCDAPDYPEIAMAALREMHRQVGDLVTDRRGLAVQGMIIRHLIMPDRHGETAAILRFIADEISPESYVNLMPQYRPCGRATEFRELAVGVSVEDIEAAVESAKKAGLRRMDR